MPDGEISIMEALNQVQSWLNAGEIEKAHLGCKEILGIEPGNQRALSLLKQAEERRFEEESKTHEPMKADEDPLANLEVEKKPEPASTPEPEPKSEPEKHPTESHDSYESYQAPQPSGKKMFLAMVVPAVLVVVIGGAIVMVLNNQAQNNLIADNDEPEFVEQHDHSDDPEPDTSYLAENEQRVTDLTEMADAIEEFWYDNDKYPSLEEVKALIEAEIGRIPSDPKQGERDIDGDPYGYMYALYDIDEEGHGSAYILSAIFQDSKGQAHAWAQGASTKHYDDFRDIDEDHVIYIGD